MRIGGGGVTIGSKRTRAGDGLTPSGGTDEAIDGNAAAIVLSDRQSAIAAHNPIPRACAVVSGTHWPRKNSSCPVHTK
jgi:hypothetical protein